MNDVCASMGDTSYEAQALKAELDEATEAFEQQKQTAEELAAAQQEVEAAHDELMTSYSKATEGQKKQSESTENLMEKLEELMTVEGKSAATKQEILAVVGHAQRIVPELGLAYDQYADELNLTADAIRNMAEAELDRQKNAENFEQLKSFLGEEDALYSNLQTSIAETTAREKELEEAQKRYNAAAAQYGFDGSQNAGALRKAPPI